MCEPLTEYDLIYGDNLARNPAPEEEPADNDNDEPEVKPLPTMTSVLDAANIFDEFFASEENCEEESVLMCKFRKKLTQRYFEVAPNVILYLLTKAFLRVYIL